MTDRNAALLSWIGAIAIIACGCCVGAGLHSAANIAGMFAFAMFVISLAVMGLARP